MSFNQIALLLFLGRNVGHTSTLVDTRSPNNTTNNVIKNETAPPMTGGSGNLAIENANAQYVKPTLIEGKDYYYTPSPTNMIVQEKTSVLYPAYTPEQIAMRQQAYEMSKIIESRTPDLAVVNVANTYGTQRETSMLVEQANEKILSEFNPYTSRRVGSTTVFSPDMKPLYTIPIYKNT